MKLSFFRTSQNEISKSQQRASLSMGQARFDSTRTSHVCEIKNYITNQIMEEIHARTLTNLGTEEKEFRCVCETKFDYLIN